MARVAVLVPDLLFGSKVQAALAQAGHDVRMLGAAPAPWSADAAPDVLVVDLTTDAIDGVAIVAAARAAGQLDATKVLGFFAHVEPEVRDRALAAGFDQVVPRSRMNREGAQLVTALAAT
jgi:CheY-like chemotaxis protein